MDARTLSKLTSYVSLTRCQQLLPGLLEAWHIAEVNTVKRRAGWLAQVLEESLGLSATTEFASGAEYEWRSDLGNTHSGDGVRFKGRGFIQVTGRAHYADFGSWCHARGMVSNSDHFLMNPADVANDRFAWISVAWYWSHPHNHGYDSLNQAADAGDLVAMTYMVNGGQNGIDTRRYYYNLAMNLGSELMSPLPPTDPHWSDSMDEKTLDNRIDARLHALMAGDNALHKERPKLYDPAGKDSGLDGRLHDHGRRIATLEKTSLTYQKAAKKAATKPTKKAT